MTIPAQISMRRFLRFFIPILALVSTSACGTTYKVPTPSEANSVRAAEIFTEEQSPETAQSGRALSGRLAIAQYRRVIARVEPVAEEFCRLQTDEREAFDCDVTIVVDNKNPDRNAFQTYVDGKPIVGFTLPFIADARNEDELAFVLGHEFGHHIGEHMKKQQQQQLVGAIIMGTITAYGQASASNANPYRSTAMDQTEMNQNMSLGSQLGAAAFSQTYELESDVIGTYIAKAAGYDPVIGARFFARPEPVKSESGTLSFWGTHPPDEKRLATVLATVDKIASDAELRTK